MATTGSPEPGITAVRVGGFKSLRDTTVPCAPEPYPVDQTTQHGRHPGAIGSQ